ncbi:winged helix DNA-binding protein [Alteraurantiacibacter aquimixticola]|uniref:MarR family transcriptional regulator n=1 Tax=Alteraurantiacibacter aquimixticola TaxID=2489173 RepID=A0A4T3F0J6_9SPHN|nr:winged helix DNA-binding protein [Alteraurantiacibacter aquimixticola]TIX50591.1 MarR family transcriptional regulator [Alteraurantiacibacter aquimixticola]
MGHVDFAYDTLAVAVGAAPSVSIFADRDDLREQMREDAEAAGMILREAGDMETLLGDNPRPLGDAVLIDCPAPDGATLAALSRIDERAVNAGAHLVVSTTMGGLEEVFGCLTQSDPLILVNASRADRAIAMGQMLAQVPNMRVRELSDEDRLSLLRLTEQVNSLAEKLERLGDDDGQVRSPALAFRFEEQAGGTLRQPGDRLVKSARPPLPDPRLIRRIIHQRQLRARFFDGDLFADPAWDMLLDLTAAQVEHTRVSVTSLCIASGVPPTTALRWISQMTDAGLLQRVEDETDRRRAFIQLTDKAMDAMARYFDEMGKSAAALV